MAEQTIDDTVMQEALRLIGRDGGSWKREYVVASSLNVDPAYQRPVSIKQVKQIAADFKPFLALGIKVSRRADGSLWVIDGQHRWRGWQMAKGEHAVIPVDPIEGLSREEEAFLFTQQNNRRNVGAIDLHAAKVASGDTVASTIQAILDRHNLHATKSVTRSQRSRAFFGVNAMERVGRQAGFGHVNEVIGIQVAGLTRENHQLHANHFTGLSALLIRFGERIDRERLIRVLRETDLETVNRQAKAVREVMRRSPENAWGAVFHAIYNHRLAGGRLPDWESVTPAEVERRAKKLRQQDWDDFE